VQGTAGVWMLALDLLVQAGISLRIRQKRRAMVA
jgi:hypothetical protein